jgi:hypothetical protein
MGGADIGKWFRARVFDAVSGSIAEAIVANRSFRDVWIGYEAESDGMGVIQDAAAAEIDAKEVVATINRMAVLSAWLMEKPEVWAAILALRKHRTRAARCIVRRGLSVLERPKCPIGPTDGVPPAPDNICVA